MSLSLRTIEKNIHLFTDNKIFKLFVISIIIISSLLVGVRSHDLSEEMISALSIMDKAITYFFLFEISLRFLSYKDKKSFFKSGWNIFDTVIVIGSLIPMDDSEMILLGRLLRIFRVLRLVSYIPELKILINTLISALPKMGYVALLMFIIFYIYAAFGNIFFEAINKDLWGDVSISLLTLFRIATFEDWTDIMYETMEIHPLSWIYYITFIFLGSFVFLNMMVGIVIDTFSQERANEDAANNPIENQTLGSNIKSNPFCDDDINIIKRIDHLDNKMDVLISKIDKINK